MPNPNLRRAGSATGLLAIVLLLGAILGTDARAGAGAYPEPPDYTLHLVPGLAIELPPLKVDPDFYDEVRWEVDGKPFLTDSFAPFEEYISTTGRFESLGLDLGVTHTLTVRAFDSFFEESRLAAEYPLVIHPLPVVNKVEVVPVVVAGRTEIVGFDLRGLDRGYRAMAWGQGFLGTSARRPLEIVRHKGSAPNRTYRIRGGLGWRRGVRPRLVVSIAARRNASEFHVPVRGRVITTRLSTKRNGNTGYKQIDGWKRCAWSLSWRAGPPRRASCERF